MKLMIWTDVCATGLPCDVLVVLGTVWCTLRHLHFNHVSATSHWRMEATQLVRHNPVEPAGRRGWIDNGLQGIISADSTAKVRPAWIGH